MHWEQKNLSHGLFVIVKVHCKHSDIGLQCILVLLFIHKTDFLYVKSPRPTNG